MATLVLVRLEDGRLVPTVGDDVIDGCKSVTIQANESGGGVTLFFPLEHVDLTIDTPDKLDS